MSLSGQLTINAILAVILAAAIPRMLTTMAPRVRSNSADRRRLLRVWRRDHECVPDPDRPGKRINPNRLCPHGTPGGHDNWGCQCLHPPGRPDLPGCEPAKVAAVNDSRRRRRAETNGHPDPMGHTEPIPPAATADHLTEPITRPPDPPPHPAT